MRINTFIKEYIPQSFCFKEKPLFSFGLSSTKKTTLSTGGFALEMVLFVTGKEEIKLFTILLFPIAFQLLFL